MQFAAFRKKKSNLANQFASATSSSSSQQQAHRATNHHNAASSARTNTSPAQLTQAYSFLTQYIHIQTTDYPWQSGGKELYNGLIASPNPNRQ